VRAAVLSAVLATGVGFALVASRGGPDASAVPAPTDQSAGGVDDSSLATDANPNGNELVDTTDRPTSTAAGFAPPLPGVPGIPSTTAPSWSASGPTPSSLTIDIKVVDANGRPFAGGSAGVGVCRNGMPQTACPAAQFSQALDADGDGHAEIAVQSDTRYVVGAFVTGTGWPGGWRDQHGTVYHFSDQVQLEVSLRGQQVISSVTDDRKGTFPVFNVIRPEGVSVRVVQANGSPFPPGVGGVMACVVDSGDTCQGSDPEWRVAHDDDGDGTVEVGLDPGVKYQVSGIANGTGWCNAWLGADGAEWHFGNSVSPVTADQVRGTLFVVPDPCPATAVPTSTTVSPGTSTPAPATTQPMTTQPATTDPVTTRPATTSTTTEPATTSPATTQPATTQPATTQPATTQPATTSPATTQPITTQPITTQPITTQPITTQPIANVLEATTS
jgi:hypothetical protein